MAWNRNNPQSGIRPQKGSGFGRLVVWGMMALALVGATVSLVLMKGDEDARALSQGNEQERPKRKGILQHKMQQAALTPRDAVRKVMPKIVKKQSRKRSAKAAADMFKNLKGNDRRLAEAVQAALDDADLAQTVAAADKALASDNPEVRQNAVEALSWFGAEALPELTACMADQDEDVRELAAHAWDMAIQEVEDAKDRLKLSVAAFSTLSDADQLSSLGTQLSTAASEVIDGTDDPNVAASYRVEIIQALVDVIDAGRKSNVEAAKEVYSDITGNEWISLDEAELYLQDPENYEPPQSRE